MPHSLTGRARYRRIIRFAAWNMAVTWWFDLFLPRIGLSKMAARRRGERTITFARRFRSLAVELGGLMIKVGQYMSSRLDVLPPELTKELEGLQDEVPAVPFADIKDFAQRELAMPFESVFAEFDVTPVAAASLGQVYRVRLNEADAAEAGFTDAVMKVQRPGIDAVVDIDLEALRRIAKWFARFRAVNKRVDAPALIEEFAATSLEEIDYLHEAANAERFSEIFAADPRVKVPAVAWERTTRRVLTLEDVTAIKINDTAGLSAAGIDPSEVAEVFAEIMFDQLFEYGFFHADPHPGNLFITPASGPDDGPAWTVTFVDFGMMGEVPATLRGNLRQLLIAAATRNSKGLVAAIQGAGVLLPTANTHEFEQVMSKIFERFGGMGFAELREVDPREFRDFAKEFGDVLFSQPFQLPADFLLIGRATSLTSGLCSSLDPDYNIWDSVEPYAQRLIRDESGNVVMDFAKQAVEVAGIAWKLPARLDEIVTRLETGTLPVSVPKVEATVERVERLVKRIFGAVIFAGLLIGGAILHRTEPGWGTALMVASGIPLVYAMFGSRR